MIRRFAVSTVLILPLLGLAACSSDAETSAASAVETTATETTAVADTTSTTITEPMQYASTIDELLAIGRPIVLAHTAGEDAYPASTMFAFGESVKAGVDMLDFNVQLSADGVLVVHHDDTVDRATNGTGNVADLTFADLHALDNSYWFTADCGVCNDQPAASYLYRGMRTGEVAPPADYVADDFAIPSFEEVVERFPTIPLNVEIKGEGEPAKAAADELARLLVELDRAEASVVSSFDDSIVSYFHSLLPDVELSPGLDASTAWVLAGTPLPDGMRILQLPPSYEGLEVITADLVSKSNAAGYPIWVWPNDRDLENLESYLAFIELGVTGLNINFPVEGVTAVQQSMP